MVGVGGSGVGEVVGRDAGQNAVCSSKLSAFPPFSALFVAVVMGSSGCDAAAPPLRHPGINAGMSPEGGGLFDSRLAGCVWEVVADPGDTWETTYFASYDAVGRRTRHAYREGAYTWFDENVSWDAGSCPTLVWGTYAGDSGMMTFDAEFAQECDGMGNVVESEGPWGTDRYEHAYDASGGIMQTRETSEWQGPEWAREYHYVWAFDRVIAATEGVSREAIEYAAARSFGADGWVRSYRDESGEDYTWTYDALGRVIAAWGDEYTYEYEGPSSFPIRGSWYDSPVEYSVLCVP